MTTIEEKYEKSLQEWRKDLKERLQEPEDENINDEYWTEPDAWSGGFADNH